VRLALGARVRSDSLGAVLRQQQAPPNGAVSLVDAGFRTVARTKQEESYVGFTVNRAFIDLISRIPEGSWTTDTRDGTPVYAAFSRSALTGMTVGLALPREEVDGPIRRILWILAGAWVVILGLGTAIGLAFGQVIVRAMRGASQSAMALARGDAVLPAHSRIIEIDELSTGLRLAAETLEARNRERDEASRLKDEFLMTVSHELRTPLTAIYGWARMLSTGQIRDAQRPRAIDAIDRNAAALQQLVNDLLDVSRVVSGRLRLDVEPIALPDVVAAAIDAIRPAAHAKQIAVVTSMDEGDLCVWGDAGRLQQVIWNLLSNAVRFTPAGGSIEVAVARASGGLEIVVSDTGPGIDAAFLPHAFERFRQGAAGTTRAHGGLGLGLAIVRHLVELHGGTVEAVNNTPAPGATFRILLPAPSVSAPATRGEEPVAALVAGSRPAIRLDGVRVLVTDDDMNARELIAVILENAGADPADLDAGCGDLRHRDAGRGWLRADREGAAADHGPRQPGRDRGDRPCASGRSGARPSERLPMAPGQAARAVGTAVGAGDPARAKKRARRSDDRRAGTNSEFRVQNSELNYWPPAVPRVADAGSANAMYSPE
jgi:signal transduction histidine kinase